MRKFSIHYEDSITIEALFSAWKAFQKGKRSRRDVADFETRIADNLIRLHHDLMTRSYRHGGYASFGISDPKPRRIHKASVRDRVVHRLLYAALYEHFDTRFIHDSYSSRREKGTHLALNRFKAFSGKASKNHTRTVWVLKCDIRKFFANINHRVLKDILEEHIESPDILWLLGVVIDSFHAEGKSGAGLPLGNLTSQLFANIYMNEFDQFAKHELTVRYYIRYADDFAFISPDRERLLSLIPAVQTCLRNRLALELHPKKIFIETFASGVDFLGWVHFPDHRVLRSATKRRMFRTLAENAMPATIASYRGMLAHGNANKLLKRIDGNRLFQGIP